MKNFFLFLILLLFIPYISHAEGNRKGDVLHTYEEDITGDGLKDHILLRGELFSNGGNYYHRIWTEIQTANNSNMEVHFGGGYEPAIQFVDLNHDRIKDVFYQSPADDSRGLYQYELFTFANNKKEPIPLPDQPYVTGEFMDGYKVRINLSPHDKPIILSLKDRDIDYVQFGIYNKRGKVIKSPNSVMIDRIALFEPVYLSDRKGYGLKSYKHISGVSPADRLGTIETLWYYENGNWIALQTEWKNSSKK